MIEKLNDAPILDQLDGYWTKMAAFLLHKLAKRGEEVVITLADMKQLEADWPGGAIVLARGGHNHIGLKLVTPEEAERAAAYDREMRGNA